jgi:hypothetical protein
VLISQTIMATLRDAAVRYGKSRYALGARTAIRHVRRRERAEKNRRCETLPGHFSFQHEGTQKIASRRIEWTYSGTQEAVDQKAQVDGAALRQQREIWRLEKSIDTELKSTGARIYSTQETRFPIWSRPKSS